MQLRQADKNDQARVLSLYRACANREGTHWRDEYPCLENITADIAESALFLYLDGDDLLGAATACLPDETEGLAPWTPTASPREISRVCIHPGFQGRGLGGEMLKALLVQLKARGVTSARLLVAVDMLPAKRTYLKLGFISLARVMMQEWDNTAYDCMELML